MAFSLFYNFIFLVSKKSRDKNGVSEIGKMD
jgi:hypothetical protein